MQDREDILFQFQPIFRRQSRVHDLDRGAVVPLGVDGHQRIFVQQGLVQAPLADPGSLCDRLFQMRVAGHHGTGVTHPVHVVQRLTDLTGGLLADVHNAQALRLFPGLFGLQVPHGHLHVSTEAVLLPCRVRLVCRRSLEKRHREDGGIFCREQLKALGPDPLVGFFQLRVYRSGLSRVVPGRHFPAAKLLQHRLKEGLAGGHIHIPERRCVDRSPEVCTFLVHQIPPYCSALFWLIHTSWL